MLLCGDGDDDDDRDDDDDDDDDGVHAQAVVQYAAERDAAPERGQSDGAGVHVRWPAVVLCYCVQLRYINIRFGV